MHRIFRYNENTENNQDKLIENIVYDCLHDFCFINNLDYKILFGVFVISNINDDKIKNHRFKSGMFIENSDNSLICKDFRENKGLYKYDNCFQICMFNTPKKGYNKNIMIKNPDGFNRCILHLKSYLKREYNAIRLSNIKEIKSEFPMRIQIRYEYE